MGKKKELIKKLLLNAFEYLNFTQYYEETCYLCHLYWGWKLPDLSCYREKIIKDYQETQKIWNNIKCNYKRSASLGSQFRLYVHLMAVGYPHCEREDFKIQDMVDSLRIHNEAWEIMCKETGIKYFSVSP